MTAAKLLPNLEEVRARGTGRWIAKCPAHADRSPSLSVAEGSDRILLYCFALCDTREIVTAMGLTMADLFFDAPLSHERRPHPKPPKVDRIALAFRFDMAALDRRIRAERVLKAAAHFNIEELGDKQLDQLMKVVARAYDDHDRADFLECVADDFRLKAYQERTAHHAA